MALPGVKLPCGLSRTTFATSEAFKSHHHLHAKAYDVYEFDIPSNDVRF